MTVIFWMLVFFFFPVILMLAIAVCALIVDVGWVACAVIGVLVYLVQRWRY
jgi:hypothetical protein